MTAIEWKFPQGHPPLHVRTMVDLFRHRAEANADDPAYTYLTDGEHAETWTFAELDQRAKAVAAALRKTAKPGDRALLLYPQGLEYIAAFVGCLYAGVYAVPAPAPDPTRLARTVPRLRTLADDAGVIAILTESMLTGAKEHLPEGMDQAAWIETDTLPAAPDTPLFEAVPEDVAYLQYTSGSTSNPRGVVMSHVGLVHQLKDFNEGWGHQPDDVMVTWLPTFHDMGLIYGLMVPAFYGFHAVVLSPMDFMRKPDRWLRAITRFGGTHGAAPNFAYGMCALKVTPEVLAKLDLSTWKVALNAAEPIRHETEATFMETFAPAGLRKGVMVHGYGMSEAICKVTYEWLFDGGHWLCIDGDAYRDDCVLEAEPGPQSFWVAGCGIPTSDTALRIVDPDTMESLAEGRVGEVWIGGGNVAEGYWNNEEATEHSFRAQLSDAPGRKWMRTGDLGFIDNGVLFISGRLKEMLIVRGQNHYPQDVEWTIQNAHAAFRPNCAAAFSIEGPNGGEELVLVAEIYPDKADDTVFYAARAAVAEHGLSLHSIHLIPPRTLPKTSSGKIQRRKSKAAFLADRFSPLASWTAKEREKVDGNALLATLADAPQLNRASIVLKHLRAVAGGLIGAEPDDLDSDSPLRDQGFDSVTAVELVEMVGSDTGLTFRTSTVFDKPSLQAFAEHVVERLYPPQAAPSGVAAMSDAEAEAALLAELEDL